MKREPELDSANARHLRREVRSVSERQQRRARAGRTERVEAEKLGDSGDCACRELVHERECWGRRRESISPGGLGSGARAAAICWQRWFARRTLLLRRRRGGDGRGSHAQSSTALLSCVQCGAAQLFAAAAGRCPAQPACFRALVPQSLEDGGRSLVDGTAAIAG